MSEWEFVHEDGMAKCVQNGLAQVAGATVLPVPGAPAVRACLWSMISADDPCIPVGGDVLVHRRARDPKVESHKEWMKVEPFGRSEVLGVLRVVADGRRITIEGHEASLLEVQELADGLGMGTQGLIDWLRNQAAVRWAHNGDRREFVAVVCW